MRTPLRNGIGDEAIRRVFGRSQGKELNAASEVSGVYRSGAHGSLSGVYGPTEIGRFPEGGDAWQALNAGRWIRLDANGFIVDVWDPKTGVH